MSIKTKKIGIISQHRTGSTFLSNHIPTTDNQYNINEFYTGYIPALVGGMQFFLNEDRVPESAKKLIFKVFQTYHNRRNQEFNESTDIFEIDLLYDFFDIIQSKGYEYFFFKFLSSQNNQSINLDNIYNFCDYVIFNYRRDTVASYISLELAKTNNLWEVHDNKRLNTYLKKQRPIRWDLKKYLTYKDKVHAHYDKFKLYVNSSNTVLIEYEDFVLNSLAIMRQHMDYFKLKNVFLQYPPMKKMNPGIYQDYMENPKDFDKDYGDLHISNFEYIGFDN